MSVFRGLGSGYREAPIAGDYAYLPDGEHIIKIVKAEGKIHSGTGEVIIEWTVEAKVDQEMMQAQKTSWMNEKGYPMLKRDIKALGEDPDEVDVENMDAWLSYFTGAYVNAKASTTTKGEKTYHNINFDSLYKAIGKPKPGPMQFEKVDDAEDELPF